MAWLRVHSPSGIARYDATPASSFSESKTAPERELKARLGVTLSHFPAIRCAYLARVSYQPTAAWSTVLSLASDGEISTDAQAVQSEFAA